MVTDYSGESKPPMDRGDERDAGEEPREWSLDELGQAYAELLQQGEDPYEPPSDQPPPEPEEEQEQSSCPLSPRSILEAILFVGHPEHRPITSREVAALMRGVRPAEIDDLVEELREDYDREQRPYTIVSVGDGYRMELREEWTPLYRKFLGRQKEARLSQAAVDVLAIVAYNPGIARHDIDRLREKPSGAILGQLVRRRLLRLERDPQKRRVVRYYPTERFLELFHLRSLDDLPQVSDAPAPP